MAMRPRVLLNCACSLDGRLAAPDGSPIRLSDDGDLRRVHRMRAASDAILVGVGTVLADDPSLRVKAHMAHGPDPLRVVLDTHGRIPPGARVLDGSAPTLVITGPGGKAPVGAYHAQVPVEAGKAGRLDLAAVLALLWDRGVRTVMVEGGGRVLRTFLEADLWDAWTLYQAPVLVGGDGPCLWPGAPADPPFPLRVERAERAGGGVLWAFSPRS